MEPVEAKDATQSGPSRAQREDFRATSDPALQRGDRSDVKLLDYTQLYNLWEKQQWLTQDLDFSQDRVDWHERIPEDERFQRMMDGVKRKMENARRRVDATWAGGA